MKRKVVLIIIVFLFNILWVEAINVTNELAGRYNFVINTVDKTKLNNNSNPNIIDDIDYMTNPNLTYENENSDIIAKKINVHIKNELEGYGELISRYSIINEVNPYLIAAMIVETTHCDSKCSVLVSKCNNVYEALYNKESISQVSCFGGDYQKFDTLDNSIKSFIKYVKTSFYNNELNTPNAIYKKYGKDVRWAYIVNKNIEIIKNTKID